MRFLARSLAASILTIGIATCSDESPVALRPTSGTTGRVAFAPVFSREAAAVLAQRESFAAVSFDHVHLVLTRPENEVVVDTTLAFTPESPDLRLELTVPVRTPNEVFTGVLDFVNAGAAVYHGDISRVVSYAPDAPVPTPPQIVLRYVGVGSNATRVAILPKTTTVRAPSTATFTATAFDANNAAIPNVPFIWSTSDASVAAINSSTLSAGVLTTTGKRGTIVVTVKSPNGLSDDATVSVVPPPTSIALLSGGNQNGKVGTALGQPAVVRVVASDGLGVPGVTVSFVAPQGGSVGSASLTTDATGTASTSLTLGGAVGSQIFTASAAGFTVNIPATASAGAQTSIVVVSGNAQRDTVLRALAQPFVAKVSDAFGNGVPGVTVTWSRVAGSGSVGNTTSVTAADGAASTVYTLGSVAGTETVTATASGVATPATFTATALPAVSAVARVLVALTTSRLVAGQTTQATATPFDAQGNALTGRTVSDWTSSNPTIASVNAGGVVTTIAAGTVTISATIEGVIGTSAPLTVTPVTIPVASVTVSLGASSLIVGQTTQATATARDAQGNILTGRTVSAWTSSNTAVASINGTGVITALSLGTATFSATIDGITGTSASLTVSPVTVVPVATVTVTLGTSSLIAGQTTQATATPRDAQGNVLTGRTVSWSSSNPAVATVGFATGAVAAVAPGTTSISATIDGVIGSASLTVTQVPVATVSVSLGTSSLFVGQTTQATATPKDAQGNVLSGRTVSAWTSSNTAIATVSASGVVTATAAGTTTISATIDGVVGSAGVTVTVVPVATVTVSLGTSNLVVGQTTQATATPKDAQGNVLTGRPVTWSTSNAAVATVSTSGVVTAIAAGTATISATVSSVVGSAAVTVTAPVVAAVGVTVTPSSIVVGQTSQATAVVVDASGNVIPGAFVTWSSSNSVVATVSATGVVTGVSAGTATISATSGGKTGTAVITVSVAGPVATVTVTLGNPNLHPGQTTQATAVARDAAGNVVTGATFTWTSSNAVVGVVSTSGLVTAVSSGNATITASASGHSGSASLVVTP
jgi:uncharacterized protein YjdB